MRKNSKALRVALLFVFKVLKIPKKYFYKTEFENFKK